MTGLRRWPGSRCRSGPRWYSPSAGRAGPGRQQPRGVGIRHPLQLLDDPLLDPRGEFCYCLRLEQIPQRQFGAEFVADLQHDLRAEQGLDPDPMAAYAASGYGEKIVAERVGGQQAGWGA